MDAAAIDAVIVNVGGLYIMGFAVGMIVKWMLGSNT